MSGSHKYVAFDFANPSMDFAISDSPMHCGGSGLFAGWNVF